MKSNGWGLQAMLFMVLFLMLLLVGVSVVINSKFGHLNDRVNNPVKVKFSYENIEKEVINSLKKYEKEYYPDILDGEKIEVRIKTLQSKDYLNKLIDDQKNECTGYGSINKKDNNIIYKAYIKCGSSYKTTGYTE